MIDGSCLLGHAAHATSPESPLADIKAAVDQAFDEAEIQLGAVRVPEPVSAGAPGPLPRAASPTPSVTMPPPPPPPSRVDRYREALSHISEPNAASDPITAFAPPPRLDWGPERVSLFDLRAILKRKG